MKTSRRFWLLAVVFVLLAGAGVGWAIRKNRPPDSAKAESIPAGLRLNVGACLRDGAMLCALARRTECQKWSDLFDGFRKSLDATFPYPEGGAVERALLHLQKMRWECEGMITLRITTLRDGKWMEREPVVWQPVNTWGEEIEQHPGVQTRVHNGVAEFEARDLWRRMGARAEEHYEAAVRAFAALGVATPDARSAR